jgi:hypothetical protein
VNGLSPDIDLSFLLGAQLEQVGIGQNEVILRLHPQVMMMIASNIRIGRQESSLVEFEDAPGAGRALTECLGSTIEEARAIGEGTLFIRWSSGHTLEVMDTWQHYESYTIEQGNTMIVV